MEHIDLTLDSIIARDFNRDLMPWTVLQYNNPRNYASDFRELRISKFRDMLVWESNSDDEYYTISPSSDPEDRTFSITGKIEKIIQDNLFDDLYKRLFGVYPKGSGGEEEYNYHMSYYNEDTCHRCGKERHFLNKFHHMLCDDCELTADDRTINNNDMMQNIQFSNMPLQRAMRG